MCPVTFSLVEPAASASFSGRPKIGMAGHLKRAIRVLLMVVLKECIEEHAK